MGTSENCKMSVLPPSRSCSVSIPRTFPGNFEKPYVLEPFKSRSQDVILALLLAPANSLGDLEKFRL